MVNPLLMLAAAFAAAFFLPLLKKNWTTLFKVITAAVLLFFSVNAVWWFVRLLGNPIPVYFNTAGFRPPFSINLRIGAEEASFISLMNISALFSFLLLMPRLAKKGIYGFMVYILLVLGVNGLVLTRDLFNTFVFLEISSISMYALIAADDREHSGSAGFKYLLAGAITSVVLIIGIAFIYRLKGTLNIDDLIADPSGLSSATGGIAVFLVIASLIIELKPFPANGWGLDAYEASSAPLGTLFSTVSASAVLFVLYKLMPLCSAGLLWTIFYFSLLSFLFSNIIACKQKNIRRMLGYSSSSQISLIVAVLAWYSLTYGGEVGFFSGNGYTAALGIFFLSHLLAKSVLFWSVSGSEDEVTGTGKAPKLAKILPAAGAVLALTSLPPSPAFLAKWYFVKDLVTGGKGAAVVLVLAASLLEIFYLFRWLLGQLKNKGILESGSGKRMLNTVFAWIFFLLLFAAGTGLLYLSTGSVAVLLALAALAGLFILDWLPLKVKGFLAIGIIGGWFALRYSSYMSFKELLFSGLFAAGGILHLVASMYKKGRRTGYIPLFTLLVFSLIQIVLAETPLAFFMYWELMTISSFFLLSRGEKAEKPGLSYLMFSSLAAFLIMPGLMFDMLDQLAAANIIASMPVPSVVVVLFVAGVLVKLGSIVFHIWVPGAYAEAEDDFSSFISSTLSKVGIFVLMLILYFIANRDSEAFRQIIGGIGIATALGGALMAVYQEDIKKTLAYSSISQIGYIVTALALTSHFGWTTALYLTFNHFLFKTMLFLAVAGVILRTGTRTMYKMGGLIKRMPLSFISVLMGIIALSGVPPLSGFGGKWFLYSALIQQGWYLHAAGAFFAGTVAFLYLFRLIHSIFLGQLKDENRQVKEAPLWLLIPQILAMAALMVFSAFPMTVLKPISRYVSWFFSDTLATSGSTVFSTLGYWNGSWVMYVTMGVFMLPLIWLMIVMRPPKKVKQFNIVFAAERPFRPETTHYSYNFFAHYQKALGFLTRPYVTKFWSGVNEFFMSAAAMFRQLYTGNGQTYALHIVLTIAVLYFVSRGV